MSHKQTPLLELRSAAIAIMVMTLLATSIFHLRKIMAFYHNNDLEAKFTIHSLLFYSIPVLLFGVLMTITALINDIADLQNAENILYCKVLLVRLNFNKKPEYSPIPSDFATHHESRKLKTLESSR
eukprot:677454_1